MSLMEARSGLTYGLTSVLLMATSSAWHSTPKIAILFTLLSIRSLRSEERIFGTDGAVLEWRFVARKTLHSQGQHNYV